MTTPMVFPDGTWHDIREHLFDPTARYTGSDWGRDVLGPWTAANPPILHALSRLGQPRMAAVALDAGDLWTLYAISRVAELLILPHQPPGRDPQPTDWLPRSAYQQFLTAIGGTDPAADAFHPFLHEIAMVEPADDPTTPPALTRLWWPGCMIGSLMLVRAGVTVHAGADHLDPVVAAGSTLYWAWRRRYRPVADLSHGWGGNSQWRTALRRDYWLGDRLVYNVDAALNPIPEQRLPHLPQLVDAAEKYLAEQASMLAAASAVPADEVFRHNGREFRRIVPQAYRTGRDQGLEAPVVRAVALDSGEKLNLTRAEDEAFRAWAAIETLRYTGIRVEDSPSSPSWRRSPTAFPAPANSCRCCKSFQRGKAAADQPRVRERSSLDHHAAAPAQRRKRSHSRRGMTRTNVSWATRCRCCSSTASPGGVQPSTTARSAKLLNHTLVRAGVHNEAGSPCATPRTTSVARSPPKPSTVACRCTSWQGFLGTAT